MERKLANMPGWKRILHSRFYHSYLDTPEFNFNQDFVETVPLLKAAGNLWDWERTTELGIIGANTRTVRMYIDPKAEKGQQQAKNFWRLIWEAQKWQSTSKKEKGGCWMPTRQTLLTQLNESVAQGIRWNLFAVVLQDKVKCMCKKYRKRD